MLDGTGLGFRAVGVLIEFLYPTVGLWSDKGIKGFLTSVFNFLDLAFLFFLELDFLLFL